jgi:hypothetical protein
MREIFNHARAIISPVSFVQVIQIVARKIFTLETIFSLFIPEVLARLNLTSDPCNRFARIRSPASRERIAFPQVSNTDPAIHPAWGNEKSGACRRHLILSSYLLPLTSLAQTQTAQRY